MKLGQAITCLFVSAAVASFAYGQDRIRGPVDRSRMSALKGNVHPLATSDNDRGPVDPGMPLRQATLLLKPQASLENFLYEQQMPASPNYHRWLTPEEFGDRFGLSSGDLAKVTAWLESQGMKVDKVARGRHWINFSGTAAQAERTFRTRFHRFTVNGEQHFANVDDPQIPEGLEEVVGGFLGLDDFKLRSLTLKPQFTNSKGAHSLAPDDLAIIYNIMPLYDAGFDGAGQKIAVIGDSSLDLSDIRSFRKTFNLPASDPQQILVGDDPGYNSDVIESNLDIEWAGAVARNAKILYVYGQSVFGAAQFAVDENLAPVLSLSFGGCEAYNRPALRAVAQQAAAQGITWLASSGDTGAAECDRLSNIPQAAKGLNIGFPASIPEITAVGGTQLDDSPRYWATKNTPNSASALGYIPEAVWNDTEFINGFSAGGGGASILFPRPYWQTGPGATTGLMRTTPDVSLAASPNHAGYLVVLYGGLYTVGGTSASSPAMAGVVALLNQYLLSKGTIAKPGLGSINPTLYRLANGPNNIFHDVTTGDNALRCALGTPDCIDGLVGHKAGPGYDLATGLGSVDAFHLVTQWSNAAASTVSVVADPPAAGLNDTVRLTATVRAATQGATPTGTVTFLGLNVSDNALGSAELTAGGIASITVPASAVIGGDGKVTALYSGNSVYGASSGSVTVGVLKPESGSMVVVSITPNPVYRQTPLPSWPYGIVLSEKAGVQTTLTVFTVNGVNNIGAFGGSATVTPIIPARGTLSTSLSGNNLTVPVDRVFHFEGKDLDGTAWSRDITVPFLESTTGGVNTAFTARSAPATVQQNPKADASCQFSHRLIVQETGGFLMQLTVLRQGTTDLSANIQQIFGTTHLAPFGTLQGDVCFSGNTTLGTKAYIISALNYELGVTLGVGVSVTLAAPAATPATMTAIPQAVTLAVADANRSAALDVAVAFTGVGSSAWTAYVIQGQKWLTATPALGNAPGLGTVKVTVNSAGLSRGAYQGAILLEATATLPQAIVVPVSFVVGTSQSTTINAIANGASYAQAFAPGMLVSVFGRQLSGVTRSATTLPLPLEMSGVSATVNGVSAPIYYVSPGQVNVQVPYEAGIGAAILGINNGGQVAHFPFTIAAAAPGIFTAADGSLAPASSARQGAAAVAYMTGDGDTSTFLITGASPAAGTATNRLPRTKLPVTVTVGGVNAAVTFAGTPVGLAGISQVNFTVPTTAPLGNQPVIITVGGVRSQTARLTVNP
ncbi:MAG: protease pro-enzyme activation domain-containing protein [Candidatus Solibacter sp.]